MSDKMLSTYDLTPQSLLFAGEVHFARANFVRSEKIAQNCSEQFPDDLSGPILRCRALLALGQLGAARDIALEIATKEVNNETHIDILTTVLSGCMEPQAAYPLCRNSVQQDPYNANAQRRLALVCRLCGRMNEAADAATVALKFNPHDYEMIGLRSAVQTATAENNHIVELETLLADGCANALGGARVAYALAKESEELGHSERAFGFLEAGARFKRQTIQYKVSSDTDAMQALQEKFTTESIRAFGPGFATDEPIFILGLPRTGSTLVERVLSSHSDIYSAGELQHFSAAVMEQVRKLGTAKDRIELIEKTLQIDVQQVGRNYIDRGRPFTGHTRRFIDKHPVNFHSIGLIQAALPDARIVHILRSPMDACYAIYKFHFNEAYPWSYSLDEIGAYYIAYRNVMDHWRRLLPDRIIDVAYEDIVNSLESTTRKLLDAIGLEWESACLDYHENQSATMTGSAAQVRQKVYSSSVERWKDYEEKLQPLADMLQSAGIDPYTP